MLWLLSNRVSTITTYLSLVVETFKKAHSDKRSTISIPHNSVSQLGGTKHITTKATVGSVIYSMLIIPYCLAV